ncbi:MAG: lmo0937 family membrane protein [Flavobacteriales bacterium]
MGNILYIAALIMIIFWAIGFFAYSVGGIIHVLLVLAIISFLVRIVSGNKSIK